jgi:VanZ family protein
MQEAATPPPSRSTAAAQAAPSAELQHSAVPQYSTVMQHSAIHGVAFAAQRRAALVLLLISSLFVIYGSWLPFERNAVPFSQWWPMLALWWQHSLQGVGLVVSGVTVATTSAVELSSIDIATNVMLALPLGFFAASMQAGRGSSHPHSALRQPGHERQSSPMSLEAPRFGLVLVCSYALLLGLLVEIGQLFLQARVASMADVLAQLFGAGVGAVVAQRVGHRLWPLWLSLPAEFAKADIWYRLAAIYAVLFFLYNALPFDITINPEAIYDKYKAGLILWQPFVYLDANRDAALTGAELWYAIASDFLVWLPLAGLGWLALGAKPKVVLWMFMYAVSTELMQLFIRSRTTDVTDVIYAMLAVGAILLLTPWLGRLGFLPAQPSVQHSVQHSAKHIAQHNKPMTANVATFWIYLASAGWALCYAAVFGYPYTLNLDALRQLQAGAGSVLALLWQELPFFSLYQSSLLTAISTILQKVLFAVPFGLALAMLPPLQLGSSHAGHRRRLDKLWFGLLWAAIVAVVLLVEISQLFIVGKVAQLLDVLLVLLAVRGSHIIIRSFLQARQRPMANDSPFEEANHTPSLQHPTSFATSFLTSFTTAPSAGMRMGVSLGISLGMLWLLLLLLLSWAGQQAALPYNVRELLGSGDVVAAAVLSVVLMIALLGWPLLLMWQPRLSVPYCGLALIGQSLLLYTLLLLALPLEVLHDVVGSPTWWRQGAGSYMEMALRFAAFMLWWQIPHLLFGLLVVALMRYLFALWLVFAPIGAGLWWLVVVYLANTDNITELLAPDALWLSSLGLWLWLHLVILASYWLSRVLQLLVFRFDGRASWRPAATWSAAIWRAGAAFCILWGSLPLLQSALASHIYKYGQQFSALQFLLSPNRQQYMQGDLLSQRYYVALSGVVLVLLLIALWSKWLVARRHLTPAKFNVS